MQLLWRSTDYRLYGIGFKKKRLEGKDSVLRGVYNLAWIFFPRQVAFVNWDPKPTEGIKIA